MGADIQKQKELEELRARIAQLESEINVEAVSSQLRPAGDYWDYYATSGFLLGMFAAMISLLANVIGAPIAGKSPLELIRVYLTFPFGERALELAAKQQDVYAIGDGVILASGCCLYLGTGMVLGIPFFMLLAKLTEGRSTAVRFIVATILALLLWMLNFYALLSWIQPALIGGNWITDPKILPTWVAIMTHLVFGWSLAGLYPLGRFQGYPLPTTQAPRAD